MHSPADLCCSAQMGQQLLRAGRHLQGFLQSIILTLLFFAAPLIVIVPIMQKYVISFALLFNKVFIFLE